MKYNNIFVEFPRIDYNFFTRKYTELLLAFIQNTRLGSDMKFEGFGKISFENDAKQLINVDVCINEFKNRNVEALVFDISNSDRNTSSFNKLIIFTQTLNKSTNYLHYVLFDTSSKKTVTHFYRDIDYTSFLNDLNVEFSRLEKNAKILHYMELGKNFNRHEKDLDMHMITNGLYGV